MTPAPFRRGARDPSTCSRQPARPGAGCGTSRRPAGPPARRGRAAETSTRGAEQCDEREGGRLRGVDERPRAAPRPPSRAAQILPDAAEATEERRRRAVGERAAKHRRRASRDGGSFRSTSSAPSPGAAITHRVGRNAERRHHALADRGLRAASRSSAARSRLSATTTSRSVPIAGSATPKAATQPLRMPGMSPTTSSTSWG